MKTAFEYYEKAAVENADDPDALYDYGITLIKVSDDRLISQLVFAQRIRLLVWESLHAASNESDGALFLVDFLIRKIFYIRLFGWS